MWLALFIHPGAHRTQYQNLPLSQEFPVGERYQKSFYSQFKVELGDPELFKTLGELVYEIHRLIWSYNHRRIYFVLKMPPAVFANRYQKFSEKMS